MTVETSGITLAVVSLHVFHAFVDGTLQVCLFNSASVRRTSTAAFSIDKIDFTLCTHYVYGYATVDAKYDTILPVHRNSEEGINGLYNVFNKHKATYPWIKTILSIGGPWIEHDLALRKLAMTEDEPFTKFSKDAVKFLREKNFDGLDVDWRYPPGAVQKLTYDQLLEALRKAFDREGNLTQLLLTATVNGIFYQAAEAYDVRKVAKYVDYVFVRAFDLIFNNTLAVFSAPLFHKPNSTLHPALNVNVSVRSWNKMGMPYSKIVVGISTLGLYVRLVNSNRYHPGSRATKEVLSGPYYNISSRLAYPEVCLKQQMKQILSLYDYTQESAFLVYDDQWIGHETFRSLEAKVKFINELKTAGIFYSALDEDDFNGAVCMKGKYPVLSYITEEMKRYVTTTTTTTTTVTANTSQTLSSTVWHRPTTVLYGPEDDDDYTPGVSFSTLGIFLLIIVYIAGCALGLILIWIVRKQEAMHADG